MPNYLEGDMKEFSESKRRDQEHWDKYLENRIVKKCKCGTIYSFGMERNFIDPGSCPSCGGRLGDVR